MKKIVKQIIIPSLCIFGLVGCNNTFKENINNANPKKIDFDNIQYTSEASKVTGNLFSLQIKTCEKAVDAVSAYIDNSTAARMAYGEIDFCDIGNFLPEDLSTLKRKKVVSNRANNIEGTISLEEELNEIIESYEESLKEITPDNSKAISVEGINTSEEGYLFGDDASIPFNSIQGIITTAVLNEIADGKDLTTVLDSIENDMSAFELDSAERAIVLKSTARWPNGVVNYRWGSITEKHKELMENAMKVWNEVTNGSVTFSEFSDTPWNNFTLAIHVRGCVIYNTNKLESGVSGNSKVGCIGGKQDLNLSDTLDESLYVRTPVHELGHALGLKHEHCRHDRDNYIIISAEKLKDTVNYGKIPLSISGWRWESRTIKIGWWRITLWYPAFWSSEYSCQSDSFDFNSVMLYPALQVQDSKIFMNGGSYRTKLNELPSQKDIAMVKRMY